MPSAKLHLPFSVPIFEFDLEKPYVDMINDWADEVQKDAAKSKKLDWSDNLVGNVVQEHAIEDHIWMSAPEGKNDTLLQYMTVVTDHFLNQVYGNIPNEPNSYRNKTKRPDMNSLTVNTSWIVNQVAGDFNPPHTHAADYSFVIFLDVPKKLKEEQRKFEGTSATPGSLMFEFTQPAKPKWALTGHSYEPNTGDMFIFPAMLQHWVVPFKSNCTRVSVSGNLQILNRKNLPNDYF